MQTGEKIRTGSRYWLSLATIALVVGACAFELQPPEPAVNSIAGLPPAAPLLEADRFRIADDASGLQRYLLNAHNSIGHGQQHAEARRLRGPGPELHGRTVLPSGPLSPDDRLPGEVCRTVEVAGVPPDVLVTRLTEKTLGCLREFLWVFDAELQALLTAPGNLTAVIQTIRLRADTYTQDDAMGLAQLVFFLRIAFYHDYFQDGLAFVDDDYDLAVDALKAVAERPVFLADTDPLIDIRWAWSGAVDATERQFRFIAEVTMLLRRFNDNREALIQDYYERLAIYSVLVSVQRGIANNHHLEAESPYWETVDPEFRNQIRQLALSEVPAADQVFLLDTALWLAGHFSHLDAANFAAGQLILSDALDHYPRFSEPYLWALKALQAFYDCVRPDGERVCLDDLTDEILAEVLPETYDYDDGTVVVRTSLPRETVDPLYFAIREVAAQFRRVTQGIAPLQADPNATLLIMLYGNKRDYGIYQPLLFDIGANNGGIYIERGGTFYTYERTPQESVYTVEELFRHEYVHYLVARYLIPGFWNDPGTLYRRGDPQDPEDACEREERLTWFDEGLAEFLAGSTRRDGVLNRQALIDGIRSDGAERMHVDEILIARYATGFRFYRYAGLFFSFLYSERMGVFRGLVEVVRANRRCAFDAYMTELSQDEELDRAYQTYLDGALARPSAPIETDVVAFDDALVEDLAAIQGALRATRLGYRAVCVRSAAYDRGRFSCRGALTGTLRPQPDMTTAWYGFNDNADEILVQLAEGAGAASNFGAVTCAFDSIRFIDYGADGTYPITQYICGGPLPPAPPAAGRSLPRVTRDIHATRLGAQATCAENVPDEIECRGSLSTRAAPLAVPFATLSDQLSRSLRELRTTLFSASPAFYRDLVCEMDEATVQEVALADGHYGVGHYACLVPTP